MQIVSTKRELQDLVKACKTEGKTIGLVPTMGALHQGHASLVKRAVEDNDICIVSVFVNPTQFNNKEDLAKYPRNIERDAQLLSSIGAHYVFAPTPEEMYSEEEMNSTFNFDFAGLDRVMEGKMRPGHFNGVVQVVSKLFYLTQPDKAYFGEKDFQQQAIIRKLVNDYNIKLQIVPCDIVREEDGLAMSSRNMRLSSDERAVAPLIYKTLQDSVARYKTMSPDELKQYTLNKYSEIKEFEVEYVEIADETTLQSVKNWNESEHARIFVALQLGQVRLIDNLRIY